MKKLLRVSVVAFLAVAVAGALMPATAGGAVIATFEDDWGGWGTTDGRFKYPDDVAADKWGNVYVTGGTSSVDVDHRVQMFGPDGTFVKVATVSGTDPGEIERPASIISDRWGHMYVTQWGNQRVEMFNPEFYNHLRTIGSAADLISLANGIAVALDGTIAISQEGGGVQFRDWFGEPVTVPALSNPAPSPTGVAISHDGTISVSVAGDAVGIYESDGTFKYPWGGEPAFSSPHDVGVDPLGNVYVCNAGNSSIQVVAPDSTTIVTFGTYGSGDAELSSPRGVGVGYDRTVYVADTVNSRVSKWTLDIPTEVVAVEGDTRYSTAVAASQKAFPDGADIVVLATGANWPDALGGSALAGAVNGPLLLTRPDSLPDEVAAEITRLAPKRVYVLGGEVAVSEAVFDEAELLTEMDIATRLDGPTRYETAIEIADETKAMLGGEYEGSAFVCTGENFPDALAASPIAAANGWPIYLVHPDGISDDVIASMARMYGGNPSNHGYIIGGSDVVSDDIAAVLNAAPFIGFTRFAGDDRYETAAVLAENAFDGMGMLFSRPALATGENFPDALAGGVLQGSDYSVMLLTRNSSLSPATEDVLTQYRDHIYEIRFLGGDDVIVPDVRADVQALLW